jgi:periplasmic divalent cation tolerance protein
MDVNWVYMTAGSTDEARSIGRELVRLRLAACINIFENMNSLFMWEGDIQDEREVVMVAKTSNERVPELVEKVKSLHSYSCPCIICLPIQGGNKDFLNWIAEETGKARE